MANTPYGIHWFRRDLRIAGNPALQKNFKAMKGNVLGLFSFDSTFLSRTDFSHHRFQFFLHTLKSLQEEMRELGGELLVIDRNPEILFEELFEKLKLSSLSLPKLVTFNRDYEPYARKRDALITQKINNFGIEVVTERDHVLIEPDEIIKESDPNSTYQVFGAFQKQWLKVFRTSVIKERLNNQKKGLLYLKKRPKEKILNLKWADIFGKKSFYIDSLEKFIGENQKKTTISLPKAGSHAGFTALKEFERKIENYGTARDVPSEPGTSHFSIFFKNGSLTVSQVIAHFEFKPFANANTNSETKFLSELIWREFYYYILYKNPRVENEAFLQKYRDISWENREDFFEAWKEGKTGFPLVDAGMRQLKTTGWMHNRVRMVVASFLIKDLLINWQWGEKYFMNQLLDGDLAPNNGGWQWAASTGCDAQPYFRIFNPVLQSKRFDPEGTYIKEYLPELKSLSPKEIHEPPIGKVKNYPSPIVDHAEQKSKALALYKL